MNDLTGSAPPTPVGSRIVATIIDALVMLPVFLVMAALFGQFGSTENDGFAITLTGLPFLVSIFLAIGVYPFVMEALFAKTIGKMAMGLRVVTVDGDVPPPQTILVRTALRVVDVLPFFYLVGFIVMMVTAKRQRIGDLAARTLVIKE